MASKSWETSGGIDLSKIGEMHPDEIIVNRELSCEDAMRLVNGHARITLEPGAEKRCAAAHAQLQTVISQARHVYGITTGFGPLANRLVAPEDGALLQQNLVNHLATGVGPAFDWHAGRAIVLARLMSILQGVSGASQAVIKMLVALINSSFSPVIPSRGTVGASGDLTPLAHMVLCFQGRGTFFTTEGQRVHATAALAAMALVPLTLEKRDGLALVNGTSAMTGIAVINADQSRRSLHWAVALTAAMAETQSARIEAWHPAFGQARPHEKQKHAGDLLRQCVQGSERVIKVPLAERSLAGVGRTTEDVPGQDAYTLRCAPQVIGAVWDTADWHRRVVTTELNAATDNPIFPAEGDVLALHGGNFMGQHVGLASDALGTAITVLAGLTERQIARLTDETLNRGLPAFLHRGVAGLNSGFMGAQVTATALLAEMRTSGPASVQSISTNGANQDVVSMGTIAARLVSEKLDLLAQIQAILALATAQAIDILEHDGQSGFSSHALSLRDMVRAQSDALAQDRPLGGEIEALAETLQTTFPPMLVV